jgi:dimethylaniline monooxygenase (N-oxide forming)
MRITQSQPTVSATLVHHIARGSIALRPNIRRVSASSVEFDDGSISSADVIVFATGYNISFPFLSPDIAHKTQLDSSSNEIQLYQNVFHPRRVPATSLGFKAALKPYLSHATDSHSAHHLSHAPPPPASIGAPIAFIGLLQPSSGGLLPMAEMQSRWACEIFKGHLSLPPPSSMLAQMQSDAAAVRKRFYGSARHSVQRDTFPYNDSLASAMGCKPPLLSMDLRLMCRLWLGTVQRTRMWKRSAPSADTLAGNAQPVEVAGTACVERSR